MTTTTASPEQAEAPAFADPTDPGHDVDVLREHVRHLERRIRQLHAPQPTASPAGERVNHHEHYTYDELFQAIAAATKIEGGGIGVSVQAFRAALASTPPAGEQKPVGKLIRGGGGAFRFAFPDDLVALYAMPPGEHDLYPGPQPEQVAQDKKGGAA